MTFFTESERVVVETHRAASAKAARERHKDLNLTPSKIEAGQMFRHRNSKKLVTLTERTGTTAVMVDAAGKRSTVSIRRGLVGEEILCYRRDESAERERDARLAEAACR